MALAIDLKFASTAKRALERTSRPRWQKPAALPDLAYDGFAFWNVLRVDPGRERIAAERLKRVNVLAYLPLFPRLRARRAGRRYRQLCAVIPGLLFVPIGALGSGELGELFGWAHVHDFARRNGVRVRVTKADIERIRRIEAKLNNPEFPVDARGEEIKIGRRARFIDPADDRLFGEVVVIAVARDRRIGLEARQLFGGRAKIFAPAVEIALM